MADMAKHLPHIPEGSGLQLDPGIAYAVAVLRSGGVETFESCESGPSHCFLEPTVRFFGNSAAGYHAISVAMDYGLPVAELRRYWSLQDGELVGPQWEMTFSRKCPMPDEAIK